MLIWVCTIIHDTRVSKSLSRTRKCIWIYVLDVVYTLPDSDRNMEADSRAVKAKNIVRNYHRGQWRLRPKLHHEEPHERFGDLRSQNVASSWGSYLDEQASLALVSWKISRPPLMQTTLKVEFTKTFNYKMFISRFSIQSFFFCTCTS